MVVIIIAGQPHGGGGCRCLAGSYSGDPSLCGVTERKPCHTAAFGGVCANGELICWVGHLWAQVGASNCVVCFRFHEHWLKRPFGGTAAGFLHHCTVGKGFSISCLFSVATHEALPVVISAMNLEILRVGDCWHLQSQMLRGAPVYQEQQDLCRSWCCRCDMPEFLYFYFLPFCPRALSDL